MAKSKRNSQNRNRATKQENPSAASPSNRPASSLNLGEGNDSLLQILLVVCTGFFLGRMLIPAESSHQGDTILFVFFWLVLFSVACWLGIRNRISLPPSIDLIDASLFLLAFLGPLLSLMALYVRGGNLRTGLYCFWESAGTFVAVFLIRKLLLKTRSMLPILLLLGIVIPISGLGVYQHYVSYPEKRAIVNPIAERWEELEQQIAKASESAIIRLQRKQLKWQKEMTDYGIPLDDKMRKGLLNRLNNSSEPTARFALANTLGGVLTFVSVLILAFLFALLKKKQALLKILLAASMMILVLYCLLLTKSRTALLGMVVGISLLFLYRITHSARIQPKYILAGIITLGLLAILVLIAVFTGGLDIEVLTEAGKSFRYRIEYWIASWNMLSEHFLFGAGPGNFREAYLEFKLPESSEVILDPHNIWLDAWSQGGIVSLIGLVLITFCVIKKMFEFCVMNSSDESPDSQTYQMPSTGRLIAGTILVILFSGIFSSPELALPIEELIGWGILIAAVSLGWAWILKPAMLSGFTLLCAATALFLHLQGAGGYSMPIVIQLLLIFSVGQFTSPKEIKVPDRIIYPVGLGIGVLLTVLCWWTSVAPKFAEGIAQARLYESRSLNESERILQQWASQDSVNPEPWMMLSKLHERSASQTRNVSELKQSGDAMMEYIKRDPINYYGYRERARLSKLLFEWSQDTEILKQAVQFQEQAINHYPNDSHLHLELAQLYEFLGENKKMIIAAQRAGDLNDINKKHGHTDRLFSEQEQAILLKLNVQKSKKTNN